jgi:hypothetical protein
LGHRMAKVSLYRLCCFIRLWCLGVTWSFDFSLILDFVVSFIVDQVRLVWQDPEHQEVPWKQISLLHTRWDQVDDETITYI